MTVVGKVATFNAWLKINTWLKTALTPAPVHGGGNGFQNKSPAAWHDASRAHDRTGYRRYLSGYRDSII